MNTQSIAATSASIKPSASALAKATGGAAIAAIAILTLFVLPAEYGIDPTGVGTALGLNGMVANASKDAAPATAVPSTKPTEQVMPTKADIARSTAWRQDEMTITLAPHSGQEVKAHMATGDSFIFTWKSKDGPVKAEMHGEKSNATDGSFTNYWKELKMTGGQGDFTAPFDGTHGWYFRNKGDTPVTVTVKTVGFYEDLFLPKGG